MPETGVKSANVTEVAIADEIIINREGRTGRQPVAALALQLSAQLSISSDRMAAQEARDLAQIAQAGAEAARDAAYVNANVYADVAAGLAGTSVGQQFQVPTEDEIIRYLHDVAGATELSRFPTTAGFDAAVAQARRAFEFDAERWFRPAFLTQNFAVTPVPRSVQFSFETSASDGSVYMMILEGGAKEPGRADIKAGVDGWGEASVYAAQLDVGSVDVLFEMPRLLADGVPYDIYVFHENGDGFAGIRHKASFTTPLILSMGALDGSLGALGPVSTGTLTYENDLDSNGGVNGIRFVDNGDTSVGVIGLRAIVALPEGEVGFRFKFRKLGGSFDYVMLTTSSYSGGGRVEVDVATGAILGTTFALAPSVTDLGDGWFEVAARVDTTGWADLNGFIEIYLRQGGVSNVLRDGSQEMRIHEFFVEG